MTIKERIAELRKFVNSFEGDVPIINALNDLDALEKLVEGEREWGYQFTTGTRSVVTGITEEMARDMATRFPEYQFVSRRKAGPWEEEPCPKK